MAILPVDKGEHTTRPFIRWFTGHLLANPINIIVVFIGTAVTILIRMLIPIYLGQALDFAIIDQYNHFTNLEQLNLLYEYVTLILILGVL